MLRKYLLVITISKRWEIKISKLLGIPKGLDFESKPKLLGKLYLIPDEDRLTFDLRAEHDEFRVSCECQQFYYSQKGMIISTYLIISYRIYRLCDIFRILVLTGPKGTVPVFSSIVILFIIVFKAADDASNLA
jgi:hypothetical protein